jgi:YebC/PmpR family DNA-binding regulatory protein
MAGHSHWANIQHKKGAVDAKRGKLWSKLSRAIIVAAKNGGGDPSMNLKLRYAIDKAKQGHMPKDTIERAIKRGTGEIGGEQEDEVTYEGFGPGGVAIMVDALTNNRARTNGEVRKLFEKGGGVMGNPGSVGYLFDRKGVFAVKAEGVDEDNLMSIALDAGAEDMKKEGDTFVITCDPVNFSKVQEALLKACMATTNAEIAMVSKTQVDAADAEAAMKVMRLMEALDDHDDVQNVYCNLNMTDELLAEVAKG